MGGLGWRKGRPWKAYLILSELLLPVRGSRHFSSGGRAGAK